MLLHFGDNSNIGGMQIVTLNFFSKTLVKPIVLPLLLVFYFKEFYRFFFF